MIEVPPDVRRGKGKVGGQRGIETCTLSLEGRVRRVETITSQITILNKVLYTRDPKGL